MIDTFLTIGSLAAIPSIILAAMAFFDGRKTSTLVKKTSEHAKELQDYVDTLQHRYVDIKYGCTFYEVSNSFQTQFAFINLGTIPATDIKIKLTYPAGTKIQSVIPPLKLTESEDDQHKIAELNIQRMDRNIPMAITLITDLAHIESPEIICNEETGTMPVSITK